MRGSKSSKDENNRKLNDKKSFQNDRMEDYIGIARFISEIGSLKNIPRSGWLKIGIKNPESVAEHSMRSAIIAFIITMLETGDFNKSVKSAFFSLIHDIHESRITDLHKLSMKYIQVNESEVKAEQRDLLPDFIRKAMESEEYQGYVKDADKLELFFQSIEYERIHPDAVEYAKNLEFQTKSARKIAESVKKIRPWWIYLE